MSCTNHRKRHRKHCDKPAGPCVDLSIRLPDGLSRQTARMILSGSRSRRKGLAGIGQTAQERTVAAQRIAHGSRPDKTAGLLAAMAHAQRLVILLKLLGGEATHRSLAKATSLKAGPLYHHLRELRMAGLIGPKIRDLYVLTVKGGRALLGILAIERLCR